MFSKLPATLAIVFLALQASALPVNDEGLVVARAPVAAPADAKLDYIYTQKRGDVKGRAAADAHLDYIYTQRKGSVKQRDTADAGLDYIYTQKKGSVKQRAPADAQLDYIYTQKKPSKQ